MESGAGEEMAKMGNNGRDRESGRDKEEGCWMLGWEAGMTRFLLQNEDTTKFLLPHGISTD